MTPLETWALAVKSIAMHGSDVPDVRAWADLLRLSERTLRRRCTCVGARTKASLEFGRLMRAVLRSRDTGWIPEALLESIDQRTVCALLRRGGLERFSSTKAPRLSDLFESHRLDIPPRAVKVLSTVFEGEIGGQREN